MDDIERKHLECWQRDKRRTSPRFCVQHSYSNGGHKRPHDKQRNGNPRPPEISPREFDSIHVEADPGNECCGNQADTHNQEANDRHPER